MMFSCGKKVHIVGVIMIEVYFFEFCTFFPQFFSFTKN